MKKMERKPDRNAWISLGISVTPGKVPIKDYVEDEILMHWECYMGKDNQRKKEARVVSWDANTIKRN